MDERIEALCRFIKGQEGRLMGSSADNGGQVCLFFPGDVFYFESVDNAVYAYLEKDVYRIQESLMEITARCEESGFLRCSRTMTINLYKIERLKSESGSRISAFLSNGEVVMISRKCSRYFCRERGQYTLAFRRRVRLRGFLCGGACRVRQARHIRLMQTLTCKAISHVVKS